MNENAFLQLLSELAPTAAEGRHHGERFCIQFKWTHLHRFHVLHGIGGAFGRRCRLLCLHPPRPLQGTRN